MILGGTLRAAQRAPVREPVHALAAEVDDVRTEGHPRAVAAPASLGLVGGGATQTRAHAARVEDVAAVRDAVASDAPAEVIVGDARAREERIRGVAAHSAVVHDLGSVDVPGAVVARGVEGEGVLAGGILASTARVVHERAVGDAVAPLAGFADAAAHPACVDHPVVVEGVAGVRQRRGHGDARQGDVREGRHGKRSRAQRDEHRENERPRPARARSPRRVRDPPRHPGRRPGGRRPTLREGRDRKSVFGGSRMARAPRAFTFEKRGNNEKCQRAARLRLFGILPAHKFGGSLDQSECGKSEISSRFVGLVGRSGTSVWILLIALS